MSETTPTPRPRTLAVIPARLGSTRLPRKMLRHLAGRPMLAWVYDAARACPELDDVVIATDSEEIEALCHANAWPVLMTSPTLASGSDRVQAVSLVRAADIYVNLQGDEPLMRPEHITALLRPFNIASVQVTNVQVASVQVTTLKIICPSKDLANPNVVKVVTDMANRALYFSRSIIPYDRDGTGPPVWKHMGLYAYRNLALQLFHRNPPAPLELAERLEQLRFLYHGIPIHVMSTPFDTIGVDTEEDLRRAEAELLARAQQTK